jgi:toxin ParE1/3/4
MKVYWSHEASRRLREITRYIAKDSPGAAQEVAKRLLQRSLALAAEGPPVLGRRLPEYPDADIRELLERPYRLIFEITARGVEIVTVMHYRQLLPDDSNALRGD